MTDKLSQVNAIAWAACDTFRGVVDPAQYKDYILVMLFLKYISDLWNDHYVNTRRSTAMTTNASAASSSASASSCRMSS